SSKQFLATFGRATHHRVLKTTHMSARFPDLGIHDDRAIHADHADFLAIGSRRRVADHVLPPDFLDVALQFNPERTVVPESVDAAINLAGLEDESPAAAQCD